MKLHVIFVVIILICFLCNVRINSNALELTPPWHSTNRYANESYMVTCRTFQNYRNLSWENEKGEIISEKSSRLSIRTQKVQHGIVLIFDAIRMSMIGSYKCVSRDEVGIIDSNSFTLNVAEPIVFTSSKTFEAILYEDVFLECKVKENLIPLRHWEFDGELLPTDERYEYTEQGLRIRNVKLEDAGKYYCVIAHSPFQTNSNRLEITLIVYTKPIGKLSETIVYGFNDEIISLECKITAIPQARFVWYEAPERVLNPKNDNVTIAINNNSGILQLIVDRNKREFICESCNELGCLNQTFILRNTTKLRRPHIGLWRLDSDAVEFYVTYQKETKYYLFEYFYQLYDDQWKKSLHKNFTVGLRKPELTPYMKFNITDLFPDTKYVVRVAAGNSYSRSEFSTERKFKTKFSKTADAICKAHVIKYNYILIISLIIFNYVDHLLSTLGLF